MSLFEKFEFVSWFIGLGLWIVNAWWMTFYSSAWLKGRFAQAIFRKQGHPEPPEKQVRWMGAVFLVVGLAFLVASISQLAHGTFKWKGKPKTYSIEDFFKNPAR